MLDCVAIVFETIEHLGREGVVEEVQVRLGGFAVGFYDGGWKWVELRVVGKRGGGTGVGEVGGVGRGNASLGNLEITFFEFG